MDIVALLKDLYGRVPPLAADAVAGLDTAQLSWAPSPGSNRSGG